MKFSVTQYIEPGKNILTQYVLLFLASLIPPCFHCTGSHQPLFSLLHWLPCWPNESRNIRCRTHNVVLQFFRSFHATAWHYVTFIFSLTVVFALIWIIQITIPVKAIFGSRNAFRRAILNTFGWMTADSSVSAYVQYLRSTSRDVLCRQSWWQRWSFWQLKYSRTIMLEVWAGCFDDLLGIGNVSYSCYLLVWVWASFCVARKFWLPCHISKKSWTLAILCNFLSSASFFNSKSFSVSVRFNDV